jgi:hypothetical protein
MSFASVSDGSMTFASPRTHFTPATESWPDVEGRPIRASGGGFLRDGARWLWYGETRRGFHEFPGISCYESSDLLNWHRLPDALAPLPDAPADHPLHPARIVERPKVLRSPATGRYVLWAHAECPGYRHARALVAASDAATGPFRFIREFRPGGAEFRDMSLFQDDDGTSYVCYASQGNRTLHLDRLTPDLLDVTGDRIELCVGEHREAPVLFRHRNRYHLLTSGTTGFAPNALRHAGAERLEGPWTGHGNPCEGCGADQGFHSQPFAVLPLPGGGADEFVYFGDHWRAPRLDMSGYVALPFRVAEDGRIVLRWHETWNAAERTPAEYRDRPQGARVDVAFAEAPEALDRDAASPVALRRAGDAALAGLAWFGWDAEHIHMLLLLYGLSRGGVATLPPRVWDGRCVELWVGYRQFVFGIEDPERPAPALGVGLLERPTGEPVANPAWRDAARLRRLGGATSRHAHLAERDPAERGDLFALSVARAATAEKQLVPHRELALAATAKDRAVEGSLTAIQTPPQFRWADTDTFHRAVLLPPRRHP